MLRKFLDFIIFYFETESFDPSRIKTLTERDGCQKLMEFYSHKPDPQKASDSTEYDGTDPLRATDMAAHDAWTGVVSDLPFVVYKNKYNAATNGFTEGRFVKIPPGLEHTEKEALSKFFQEAKRCTVVDDADFIFEAIPSGYCFIVLINNLLNLGLFEEKVLSEELVGPGFVSTYLPQVFASFCRNFQTPPDPDGSESITISANLDKVYGSPMVVKFIISGNAHGELIPPPQPPSFHFAWEGIAIKDIASVPQSATWLLPSDVLKTLCRQNGNFSGKFLTMLSQPEMENHAEALRLIKGCDVINYHDLKLAVFMAKQNADPVVGLEDTINICLEMIRNAPQIVKDSLEIQRFMLELLKDEQTYQNAGTGLGLTLIDTLWQNLIDLEVDGLKSQVYVDFVKRSISQSSVDWCYNSLRYLVDKNIINNYQAMEIIQQSLDRVLDPPLSMIYKILTRRIDSDIPDNVHFELAEFLEKLTFLNPRNQASELMAMFRYIIEQTPGLVARYEKFQPFMLKCLKEKVESKKIGSSCLLDMNFVWQHLIDLRLDVNGYTNLVKKLMIRNIKSIDYESLKYLIENKIIDFNEAPEIVKEAVSGGHTLRILEMYITLSGGGDFNLEAFKLALSLAKQLRSQKEFVDSMIQLFEHVKKREPTVILEHKEAQDAMIKSLGDIRPGSFGGDYLKINEIWMYLDNAGFGREEYTHFVRRVMPQNIKEIDYVGLKDLCDKKIIGIDELLGILSQGATLGQTPKKLGLTYYQKTLGIEGDSDFQIALSIAKQSQDDQERTKELIALFRYMIYQKHQVFELSVKIHNLMVEALKGPEIKLYKENYEDIAFLWKALAKFKLVDFKTGYVEFVKQALKNNYKLFDYGAIKDMLAHELITVDEAIGIIKQAIDDSHKLRAVELYRASPVAWIKRDLTDADFRLAIEAFIFDQHKYEDKPKENNEQILQFLVDIIMANKDVFRTDQHARDIALKTLQFDGMYDFTGIGSSIEMQRFKNMNAVWLALTESEKFDDIKGPCIEFVRQLMVNNVTNYSRSPEYDLLKVLIEKEKITKEEAMDILREAVERGHKPVTEDLKHVLYGKTLDKIDDLDALKAVVAIADLKNESGFTKDVMEYLREINRWGNGFSLKNEDVRIFVVGLLQSDKLKKYLNVETRRMAAYLWEGLSSRDGVDNSGYIEFVRDCLVSSGYGYEVGYQSLNNLVTREIINITTAMELVKQGTEAGHVRESLKRYQEFIDQGFMNAEMINEVMEAVSNGIRSGQVQQEGDTVLTLYNTILEKDLATQEVLDGVMAAVNKGIDDGHLPEFLPTIKILFDSKQKFVKETPFVEKMVKLAADGMSDESKQQQSLKIYSILVCKSLVKTRFPISALINLRIDKLFFSGNMGIFESAFILWRDIFDKKNGALDQQERCKLINGYINRALIWSEFQNNQGTRESILLFLSSFVENKDYWFRKTEEKTKHKQTIISLDEYDDLVDQHDRELDRYLWERVTDKDFNYAEDTYKLTPRIMEETADQVLGGLLPKIIGFLKHSTPVSTEAAMRLWSELFYIGRGIPEAIELTKEMFGDEKGSRRRNAALMLCEELVKAGQGRDSFEALVRDEASDYKDEISDILTKYPVEEFVQPAGVPVDVSTIKPFQYNEPIPEAIDVF
jgi:hypothetical protein